jgi:hypothetical protein
MRRYLTERIDAGSLPLVGQLKPLRNLTNAAGVTLRRRGAVVALQIRDDGDLCRNVAAAALRAMRSSRLPDRVDRKVLDALTVEVEVLSPPRVVGREQLADAMIRGLTGLGYSRRDATTAPAAGSGGVARVMPSGAYVLGLDAEQMRHGAMSRFRLTQENVSRPARLEVFTARHYVGYADGRVTELFRGKDLRRRDRIDAAALRAAAEQIGEYLIRQQTSDGLYSAGGLPGTPREHLAAARAMAEFARRRPDRPAFARSVALAVTYARRLVKTADGLSLVAAESRQDTVASTALLAMTLAGTDPGGEARALRGRLLASLEAELRPMVARGPASRPASASAETYMAFVALTQSGGAGGGASAKLTKLREALSRAAPAGTRARLWAYRAGLLSVLPVGAAGGPTGIVQRPADALPDEVGGFAAAGCEPSTTLTALAAACLARAAPAKGSPAGPLRRQLAEARRFCYRMVYQPSEAYFAADPAAWRGAVRLVPGASLVSLPACAAGIEAALAGQD